jgi:manganese/iron transport system ATP-binding protein
VLLARAIAQQASLLLLDEPFNGVDSTPPRSSSSTVLGELRAEGVAVVMSTHDLAVAHLACDDACLLNHHQVAFGPTETTLTPGLLQQTYGAGSLALASDRAIVTGP